MNSGPDGSWWTTEDIWPRVSLPVLGWAIWYADGSVVRSSDSTWAAAPAEGVQVVMVFLAEGRRLMMANRDEYTMTGEETSKLGLMIDFDRYEATRTLSLIDAWRP